MSKRVMFVIYLICQIATLVLLPLGLILKKQMLLYLTMPFALVSFLYLLVFLFRSGKKQD